jgi:hypothetical protein
MAEKDANNDQLSHLKHIGLYPCDRATIFGGAGSTAFYRSKKYDGKSRRNNMLGSSFDYNTRPPATADKAMRGKG